MPLHRRLPKRGFTNIFRKVFAVVNVSVLAEFEAGAKIDPETLRDRGIAKKMLDGLKILGNGEINHAVHVRAHRFSKSAIEKIQKAGGTIEVIGQ